MDDAMDTFIVKFVIGISFFSLNLFEAKYLDRVEDIKLHELIMISVILARLKNERYENASWLNFKAGWI